jgi:hypothetical protein
MNASLRRVRARQQSAAQQTRHDRDEIDVLALCIVRQAVEPATELHDAIRVTHLIERARVNAEFERL